MVRPGSAELATAHTSRWLGRRFLVRRRRLTVSSYIAMLYLGCVAGTYLGARWAGSSGLDEDRFVLGVVILLVPALVGSRLWFVVQHLDHYRANPGDVWNRGRGGSALYGGLLLSLAVSVPLLAALGLPFWGFWDAASLTMLVGLVPTRFGCAMNGCCSGRPTSGRLAMWMPDLADRWERRYPSPLLEALWATVILVAVLVVGDRLPFAGARLLAVVGGYAAGRTMLETTRQATGPTSRRTNVVTSVLLLVSVLSVLVIGAAVR